MRFISGLRGCGGEPGAFGMMDDSVSQPPFEKCVIDSSINGTESGDIPVVFPHDLSNWMKIKNTLTPLGHCKTLDDIQTALCHLWHAYTDESSDHFIIPDSPQLTIDETPYSGLLKFLSKYTTDEEKERFINHTLPHIVGLVQNAAEYRAALKEPLCYSRAQEEGTTRISRQLVSSIVACGILCLFPEPPGNVESSGVNFTYFYRHTTRTYQRAKFRCILNYMFQLSELGIPPRGYLEITRVVIPIRGLVKPERLLSSKKKLCPLVVCPDGKIEDSGAKVLQLDFANEYLGGGVLHDGNVQEEILFSLCPELLASMLFMDKMSDNEAVTIQGHEKYSNSVGYGGSFRFAPKSPATEQNENGELNKPEEEPYDKEKDMLMYKISAIDATPYGHREPEAQYETSEIMREFNKAYAGFIQPGTPKWTENELDELARNHQNHNEAWATNLDPHKVRAVATGNWGCGVFGGDSQMKAMLQWLAASHAGCPAMIYYTFQLWSCDYFEEVVRAIGPAGARWTVGDLSAALFDYAKRYNQCDFFQVLLKQTEPEGKKRKSSTQSHATSNSSAGDKTNSTQNDDSSKNGDSATAPPCEDNKK